MTQISLYTPIRNGNLTSTSQLQLDAALNSFSSQATDTASLASMTLVGFAGKLARIGILSTFGRTQQAAPLQLLSHLGSVAAEAATMTSISRGGSLWPPALDGQTHGSAPTQEFLNHFINFGIFRLMGGVGGASGAPAQHLIQSLAMMAGHHTATFVGLETGAVNGAPSKSLAEQFLEANLTTLQISVGSTLASRLNGGRLERLQQQAEQANTTSLIPEGTELTPLQHYAANEGRGRNGRKGTDVATRFSKPAGAMSVEDPIASLAQLHRFISSLDSSVNQLTHFVENTAPRKVTIQDLNREHAKLNPGNNEWRGYFRNRLDEFGRAIQACESATRNPQTPTPSPEITRPVETPIRFPKLYAIVRLLFGWLPFWTPRNPAPALPPPVSSRVSMAAGETQSHREAYIRLYDQLVLLQEALRIVTNDHSPLSDGDQALVSQMESAYEGLHENLQKRREELRRSTTRVLALDMKEFVDQWGDAFLRQVRNLRITRNIQTLLGRVYLAQGVRIGGSFYGAFHEATRNERSHIFLSIYFDHETAQVLAFDDGSNTSKDAIAQHKAARRGLTKVHYVVDREESGKIIDVEFNDPHMAPENQRIIRGLIGLQVAPENYIYGYSDLNPAGAHRFIISNRIRQGDTGLYDIIAIATPDHANHTLFTVREHGKPESNNIQLWVTNRQAERLPKTNQTVRILRVNPGRGTRD